MKKLLSNNLFNTFLVFLGSLLVLLPGINGNALLTQGDESMHIHSIRETIQNGEFWIPILSGVPNPYKPPFLFWMGESIDLIFGMQLWSERLPSVFIGSSTVALLFYFFKSMKLETKISLFWSLLYLFSLAVFKFAKLAMMEQYMAFFSLLSAIFIVYFDRTKKIKFILFAGVSTGIGYLLKGPLLLIYILLLLFIWSSFRLFRFDLKPFQWKGKKLFLQTFKVLSIFTITSICIPAIYYISLLNFSESGIDLIKFFFIVENIGKFGGVTQPISSIVWGIVLYTIPWTFILLFSLRSFFSSKGFHYKIIASRLMISASLLMILLHIIPDRKEAYYVIPALPLLFAGIGLLKSKLSKISRFALKFNLGFTIILIFLLAFLLFYLGIWKNSISLLVGTSLVFGTLIIFFSNLNLINKNLILGLVLLICFQYGLLPLSFFPTIPENLAQNQTICVISENPWTVYELEAIAPKLKFKHAAPEFPETCGDSVAILEFDKMRNLNNSYTLKNTWKIWKSSISSNEILNAIKDINIITKTIKYYEIKK